MKSKPRCVVCEAKNKITRPMSKAAVVCAECFGRAEGGTCIGCLGCVHTLVYGPKSTVLVIDTSGRRHKCKGAGK